MSIEDNNLNSVNIIRWKGPSGKGTLVDWGGGLMILCDSEELVANLKQGPVHKGKTGGSLYPKRVNINKDSLLMNWKF